MNFENGFIFFSLHRYQVELSMRNKRLFGAWLQLDSRFRISIRMGNLHVEFGVYLLWWVAISNRMLTWINRSVLFTYSSCLIVKRKMTNTTMFILRKKSKYKCYKIIEQRPRNRISICMFSIVWFSMMISRTDRNRIRVHNIFLISTNKNETNNRIQLNSAASWSTCLWLEAETKSDLKCSSFISTY